jgi:hypothetical protein
MSNYNDIDELDHDDQCGIYYDGVCNCGAASMHESEQSEGCPDY